MIRCDALIVGGGPGGSTCARLLRRAGWDVIVADRARFPRDKVCAGWLTPEVFPLLDLDPAEYQVTGMTFEEITAFRTGVMGGRLVETRYPTVASYAIRRYEFDDYLLRRAQVRVLENTSITTLRRSHDTWIANETIETPMIVGAGGHFCPVARHMRAGADTQRPVVAKEAEFQVKAHNPNSMSNAPELFFCRDFEGYGWCVRKGDYLNVGLGRRFSQDFSTHLKDFMGFLERHYGLPRASDLPWRGHAYLAYGAGPRPLIESGMMLVGDAAGLAYPESGEGIKPAIESGRLAAHTLIEAAGRHGLDDLRPYADQLRSLYPPVAGTPAPVRAVVPTLGRLLLASRAFTRHVLLDRWFLRSGIKARGTRLKAQGSN